MSDIHAETEQSVSPSQVPAEYADYEDGVRCVVMPCCGFTYAEDHLLDGIYVCPLCDKRSYAGRYRAALEAIANAEIPGVSGGPDGASRQVMEFARQALSDSRAEVVSELVAAHACDGCEERHPWRECWEPGSPCMACGSTDTYGYAGNAGCRSCGAHDQDGG